jgi:drug/metabolite transporter (DMT)-like permease
MDLWHVIAALASAVLHAGWNAAIKANANPKRAMTAQMVASAAIVVPGLAWTGLPTQAAWAWIAASTLFNLVTVSALLRAYTWVGFGTAYPVVRALSVVLVVPLAAGLSGETPSIPGLLGIGLVAASLLVLGVGNAAQGGMPRQAAGAIAIAAAATAAYVVCDAQGVRRAGSPWAYGFTVSTTNALAMAWMQGETKPWRLIRANATIAGSTAIAAVASYLLILWIWSSAPIAPSAALRDTSAVFAVLIAIFWLREPFTGLRIVAVLLAAAAIPLLRFA